MSLNHRLGPKDWAGLRVWILGASGGIGTALSVALAKRGAVLAISGRRAEALTETAAECLSVGASRPALQLPLDINDTHAVATALASIQAQMGGIDLIVINAGTYQATRANELNPESINSVIETNLLSPMRITSVVLPALVSQMPATDAPRGIAFVSSVAGYRGLPRSLTYGPGKAALISFAESLWQDLNPLGLNVWLINPGFVRSRLTDKNDFKMPALIDADTAAEEIIKGLAAGQFEIHFPKRFTRFMKLLRLLPISWYLRLSQRLVPPLSRTDFASPKTDEGSLK